MYTHENFEADVATHFAFLESDFGMHRQPMQVSGIVSWVIFVSGVAKLIVEQELGGYCTVSLLDLKHTKVDPIERSEFDLDEVVAVAAKRPPRQRDPRTMAEAVVRAAETLKAVGESVLTGDFEALHARQRKVVETVRRHNPTAVAK